MSAPLPLLLVLAAALSTAACATPTASEPAAVAGEPANPPAEPEPTPMPKPIDQPKPPAADEPALECDASATAWAVGQVADTNLIERIRVETKSERVRVLKPGMMATMDFRADRVNIDVDADDRVLRVRCG